MNREQYRPYIIKEPYSDFYKRKMKREAVYCND
jgi:hypothetical protein